MENELQNRILAILFASGEPVELARLCGILGLSQPAARMQVQALRESLASTALTVVELEDSFQLTNQPRYAPDIRAALELTRNVPLSQAALEVLAVVAYNQPVTRAFVEEVRGVDCSSILSGLVDKALLEEAGRLELPGRPIAYRTTPGFLRVFGLRSLQELPEPGAAGSLPGQLGIFDLPEAPGAEAEAQDGEAPP